MVALLALVLGAVGVGYAVWPRLRGTRVAGLRDESPGLRAAALAEAEVAAIREWSLTAGELRSTRSAEKRDESVAAD